MTVDVDEVRGSGMVSSGVLGAVVILTGSGEYIVKKVICACVSVAGRKVDIKLGLVESGQKGVE